MFMYNKLLIITIFCLGVVACTQSRKKNCNSVDNGQAKAEIFTATKKKYPSKTEILKELQGEWFCYKYVKNDTVEPSADEYAFDRYNENFAKEFSKYAYFTISNDTLKGMDIYNTPIRIYKCSTRDWGLDDEEVTLLNRIKSVSDTVFFVAPVKPYEYYRDHEADLPAYTDAPLNKNKVLCNNNLVIYYRECFFFFKKDSTRVKSNCYGVPGDERNYFRVSVRYNTTDIKKVCDNFKQNYPYGANLILTYNNNESKIKNHDWLKINYLTVENDAFASGKFILKIIQSKEYTDLLYYKDDFYDSDMEGYDDYGG